ncbi:hypothetical protein SAMN02910292_03020 [Lachnospiraceae bacterium XBB2008]|nr:hypothetical protein SAMN02910292_03020 [Lachnospiraceae bacterium XBB2008]
MMSSEFSNEIKFKCSDREKAKYQKIAEENNLYMSEYIRNTLNNVLDTRCTNKKRTTAMSLVQNQECFNQIDRYCKTHEVDDELIGLIEKLYEGELQIWNT